MVQLLSCTRELLTIMSRASISYLLRKYANSFFFQCIFNSVLLKSIVIYISIKQDPYPSHESEYRAHLHIPQAHHVLKLIPAMSCGGATVVEYT